MRVLLDERYAPITWGSLLLETTLDDAQKVIAEKLAERYGFHEEPSVTPVAGTFDSKIQKLAEFGVSDWPNRLLLIPIGNWVAIFSACGGSSLAAMLVGIERCQEVTVSQKLVVKHCPGMTKRQNPAGERYSSISLWYYRPKTRTTEHMIRHIEVISCGEESRADRSGTSLPGECNKQWAKRRYKDKFTSESIHQILLNFGIDYYNEETYSADGLLLQFGPKRMENLKTRYTMLAWSQRNNLIVPGLASKVKEAKPEPQPITGPPVPEPLIPVQPDIAFHRLPDTREPGAHLEPWTTNLEGETITCWAAWTDLPSTQHPASNTESPSAVLAEPPFTLKPGTTKENLYHPESLTSDYTLPEHGDQVYRNYALSDNKNELQQQLDQWMSTLTAERDHIRREKLEPLPQEFTSFTRLVTPNPHEPHVSTSTAEEIIEHYDFSIAESPSERGVWFDGKFWSLRVECPTGCGADLYIDIERPDPLEMCYRIVPDNLEPWWEDNHLIDDSWLGVKPAAQPEEAFDNLEEGTEPGRHLKPWTVTFDGKQISCFAGWTDRPTPLCPACQAEPAGWPVVLESPPFTVAPGTTIDTIFDPDSLITPFTCPECDENLYTSCQIFANRHVAEDELDLFMTELDEQRVGMREEKFADLPQQFDAFLREVENCLPTDKECADAANSAELSLAPDEDSHGLWFDGTYWRLTVPCPTGSGASFYIDTERPGYSSANYKIKPTA